ncbi:MULTISPECIES: phosphorothioated DNA-binding restriction endonuclease [Streptomyces]|uniref:Restriction endonuclease n=1 Tax=Streptomyces lycii TaxID=2654337 RepID=A0ABQ7FNG9_9ACTN|nr:MULTISPECIES: HNH endonuclease [Streptomyces]KAF4409174.1 restriction endonuclease [Streptomyces lycii]PGH48505.1 restriction endonuclease [Streptomyces sp. Ru87]
MDWTERVGHLRQWNRGGERAPHKPLLLLYALGRFQRRPGEPLRYSDIERDLSDLLQDYGPPRRTSPAYPFHHLAGDGVWEVRTNHGTGSPGTGVRALRESEAEGRLVPALRAALAEEPALLGRLAHLLLDTHFPPSLHADIAEAAGLDLELADRAGAVGTAVAARTRQRAAELRRSVLTAYEHRCAFCGFDGALGRIPVALEAAHVRWWAFSGPDELSNALCLCSLHHKLFDRGVLGLDRDRRITVSREFTGRGTAARRQVLDLTGRELTGPQAGSAEVAPEHIGWHTGQVFRGEARTPEPSRV